jgi:hypothetical protein
LRLTVHWRLISSGSGPLRTSTAKRHHAVLTLLTRPTPSFVILMYEPPGTLAPSPERPVWLYRPTRCSCAYATYPGRVVWIHSRINRIYSALILHPHRGVARANRMVLVCNRRPE